MNTDTYQGIYSVGYPNVLTEDYNAEIALLCCDRSVKALSNEATWKLYNGKTLTSLDPRQAATLPFKEIAQL